MDCCGLPDMIFRLKKQYFEGPGRHVLQWEGLDGVRAEIAVDVDSEGYFTADRAPLEIPITIFAFQLSKSPLQ